MCLGNISGDFSASDMKKAALNGCVYDFSVDYKPFDTCNINENNMKKDDMK